ncbi:MAG: hypothetical protein ACOCRZ_02455 [Halothermotrichaceae bacterium]
MTNITLDGWLSQGWSAFVKRPLTIIFLSILMGLNGTLLIYLFNTGLIALSIFLLIIEFITLPVLSAGICYFLLLLVRKKETSIEDIFTGFSSYGTILLTASLLMVISTGGFLLLIIPGIIWALKYMMSLIAIIDKDYTFEEAVSYSAKITKGHKGKLFLLVLIPGFLNTLADDHFCSSLSQSFAKF